MRQRRRGSGQERAEPLSSTAMMNADAPSEAMMSPHTPLLKGCAGRSEGW